MSLREQLRGRSQPTEVVRLPTNPQEYARLERLFAAAEWALDQARASGGLDTASLRARLADAQAALDASPCVEVTLRTLPPPEWEALVELHPATEDQQSRGAQWNAATFRPAVLAACVVTPEGEEPLTAEDWEHLVKDGQLTAGEFNALANVAVTLNLRVPMSAVGKGS